MGRGTPSPRFQFVIAGNCSKSGNANRMPQCQISSYPILIKKVFSIALALAFFNVNIFAQTPAQSTEPISETQAMLQETTVLPTDSLSFENTEDAYNNDLTPQQRFEENPKHNIHEYDYKQQVIVGGVVMLCVALAMVMNNNYNPKR